MRSFICGDAYAREDDPVVQHALRLCRGTTDKLRELMSSGIHTTLKVIMVFMRAALDLIESSFTQILASIMKDKYGGATDKIIYHSFRLKRATYYKTGSNKVAWLCDNHF